MVLEAVEREEKIGETMTKKSKIGIFFLVVTFLAFSNIYAQETAEEAFDKGSKHFESGNFDGAISDYSKAIELKPNHTKFYYNRAVTYYSKQEYAKAWEDVHKIEALGDSIHPDFLKELKKASGREN